MGKEGKGSKWMRMRSQQGGGGVVGWVLVLSSCIIKDCKFVYLHIYSLKGAFISCVVIITVFKIDFTLNLGIVKYEF